jgi:hypothetical protein
MTEEDVRLEVFMAVTTKNAVLWDVTFRRNLTPPPSG